MRGSDLTALRKQAIRDGRLKMLHLEHHRALGETWQEKVDGEVKVYTIRGENVRHIFASRVQDFSWNYKRPAASTELLGRSGFLGGFDDARRARKLVNPTFTKYENGTMPMLRGHVDRFIDGLPRNGQAFDLQPLLKRLVRKLPLYRLKRQRLITLSISTLPQSRCLMYLLECSSPRSDKMLNSFSPISMLLYFGLNKRRMGFTFSAFFKFLFDRSYARGFSRIHKFVDDMVQAAIDRACQEKSEKDILAAEHTETESKAGRYILVDELVKQTQDRVFLRDAMLQAFIPARENAAILISNTIWALPRHPEYWTRLRPLALELSEDEAISFPRLAGLSPIRHTVLEAIRLYGAGGFNWRASTVDVVLPKGSGPDGESPLFVAAGTRIAVHTSVMPAASGTGGRTPTSIVPSASRAATLARTGSLRRSWSGQRHAQRSIRSLSRQRTLSSGCFGSLRASDVQMRSKGLSRR